MLPYEAEFERNDGALKDVWAAEFVFAKTRRRSRINTTVCERACGNCLDGIGRDQAIDLQ